MSVSATKGPVAAGPAVGLRTQSGSPRGVLRPKVPFFGPEPVRAPGLSAAASKGERGLTPVAMRAAATKKSMPAGQTWTALTDALRGLSFGDISTALAELGFAPVFEVDAKQSRRRFRGGTFELTVAPTSLGLGSALQVSLEDRAAPKKARLVQEGFIVGRALLGTKTFEGIQSRYREDLAQFQLALGAIDAEALPTEIDGLKRLFARGQSAKKSKKEAAQAAEISRLEAQLTTKLDRLTELGNAPKGIIVYVDGPDGAGKSSTGAIVMRAVEEAGYVARREVFKAPTEAERKGHWLKRFERGIPKAGEVVFWDRGPAGDAVYGKPSAGKRVVMAKEFVAFERELAEEGILLFKLELYASAEKQAETFGKRLARQVMAAHIRDDLAARGKLDAKKAAGLEEIAGKLDADDFRALESHEAVQAGFLSFAEQSGAKTWQIVDATKRHAARLEIIARFDQVLGAFATCSGAKAA